MGTILASSGCAIVSRLDCSLWVQDLHKKPISRFSIHGYILREFTGEWHTNGVTRESFEMLVSHENGRPYLQAKIPSIQVPFFRKSYACYSDMEIPLTTTIKIIIIAIII